MRIHFLTTGGTIDKVYFDANSDFQVGTSKVSEMLRESQATIDWDIKSLFRKDSLDLTDEDRAAIRRHIETSEDDRFVVTHGTDTIVESARAMVGIEGKVVVFTGSLRPARFKSSDAVFNIGSAVAAVQALPPGIYITVGGRIYTPDRVRKNREKNRFEDLPGDAPETWSGEGAR